jgi:GntR family transcriptional repressor for pyruvate dehydrogenase complex
MFRPVKQNRAFEEIILQIEELILAGEINPGDKLPSERMLVEMFRVSRGSLREAFRALEQKRLITVKTGADGGAYVCDIGTEQIKDNLDFLLRYQKVTLKDLSEFREEVEGVVVEKATQKASKEDIDTLELLLKSMKDSIDKGEDWIKIRKQDVNFHQYLARISGNIVYESVLQTIYENINRYFDEFLPKSESIAGKTYRDLCAILKAIETRNCDTAKSLTRQHIRRFSKIMKSTKCHAAQ